MQRPDTFTINPEHHLANGLVFAGLGNLAGTTHYHDSSVFGNHGTLTNMDSATDWVSALGRRALDFDGSNDYTSVQYSLALPLSIAAWIYFADDAATVWSVSVNDVTASTKQYAIGRATPVGLDFSVGCFERNGTFYGSGIASASLAFPSWRHVVGIFRATDNRQAFIDGKPATAGTNSITAHAAATIDIGRLGDDSPSYAASIITDACVYNRTLSLPEIQQLADPSNVMLSGLILPPQRKWWPVVSGATSIIPRIMRHRKMIGVS